MDFGCCSRKEIEVFCEDIKRSGALASGADVYPPKLKEDFEGDSLSFLF